MHKTFLDPSTEEDGIKKLDEQIEINKGLFGFKKKPSLITPHSIFVTHHSLLKILKFPNPTRLAHFTQLLITHTSLIFVGPIPITWSDQSY